MDKHYYYYYCYFIIAIFIHSSILLMNKNNLLMICLYLNLDAIMFLIVGLIFLNLISHLLLCKMIIMFIRVLIKM
jgi:hypothetical protein